MDSSKNKRSKTAEDLAERIDAGKDITDHAGYSKPWRLNVELPGWIIRDLDAEASRLRTSRLHVLKTLLDGGLRKIRVRDQKTTA
jgi:hypothetical protein